MPFYKNLVYFITLFYAIYILSFEPSFYNDDSLFLTRGIDNFSVIDFSPHFPGYVVIIILGKFINFFINDSKYSLFLLTSLSAIFLPFLLFFYVKLLSNQKSAFFVFLLTISSIYLKNLSLSMLSDSVGLFLLFLSLYLFELNKNKASGFVSSMAFFARPSYFIFFISAFLYIYFTNKKRLKNLLIFFILGTFCFLVYTFLYNGYLYVEEAIRFIEGHFQVWGVGQNSDISWSDNIFKFENIVYILLPFALFKLKKEQLFLWFLFFSYLLWMIFAQNPDNLRHMIPLVFLANIIVVLSFKNITFFMPLFLILNLYFYTKYDAKFSPIEQVLEKIKDDKNIDKVIITNRGIEILREKLENRIVDNYYKNSASFALKNQDYYKITTEKQSDKKSKIFKGRFIGEHDLYLIQK